MGENDWSECVGSFALYQVGTKSHPRWMYHSGALTEKRGNKILNGGGGVFECCSYPLFPDRFLQGFFAWYAGKEIWKGRLHFQVMKQAQGYRSCRDNVFQQQLCRLSENLTTSLYCRATD